MNKLLISKLFFSYLVLMFTSSVAAQINFNQNKNSPKPTTETVVSNEAIELYNQMAYKASIDAFMKQDNLSISDKLKVADSYRMIHDTKKAELWYQQVVDKNIDDIHLLHYAQTLQSNGKTQLAAQYFSEFSNKTNAEDGWENISTSYAENMEKDRVHTHTGVSIKNEKNINSNGLDYSPLYFENGIIFVSSKNPEVGIGTNVDPWMKEHFMSLLFSEKMEDGHYKKPKTFSKNLTSIYHEGPSSYSPAEEILYFSRNHTQGQKKIVNAEGVTRMQIYQATKKGNDWTNIKELNFNLPKFDNCHPSISADGTTLYFASNRAGGYGGMDLYVTTFNGSKWSQPTNLGPSINTAGHEVFPFIHNNGTLFFSSNGFEGVGGLDIFQTKNREGIFSTPVNVGKPFNSSKDDFGFILGEDQNAGMFSSARSGGSGKDDIYSFEVTNNSRYCVYDASNDKTLANTELLIYENINENSSQNEDAYFKLIPRTSESSVYDLVYKSNKTSKGRKITTDNNGYFTMVAAPDKDYHIRTVDGQTELKGILSTRYASNLFSSNDDATCIPMNIKNTKRMSNLERNGLTVTVKNKKYNKLVPNATIKMVNLCTGEEYDYQTNQDGNVFINSIECGCEFTFTGQKKNFQDGFATLSTLNEDCKDKKKIELEVGMYPANTISSTTPVTVPSTKHTTILPAPKTSTTTTSSLRKTISTPSNYIEDITAVKNEDLKEGNIIVLDIYYGFDESYISPKANMELDKVVKMMQKHPNISVELSSHTDNRGASDYNAYLSMQRAQQAVSNIIRKGISTDRISAEGFGEDRPKIDCRENCTENQHQENRRTEVKIISVK